MTLTTQQPATRTPDNTGTPSQPGTPSQQGTPGHRELGTVPRHSILDDVAGILTGTLVVSLGLFLLTTSAAVTGGTAGLALLLSYAAPLPFSIVFVLVNLPFLALAAWQKGWDFTLRTLLAVGLVSAFSAMTPHVITIGTLNPVYGMLLGNLLAGVGLLILFRHRASLGGFNILALLLQERLNWRAGYVQMVLDLAVVVAAFTVMPPLTVALSAAGAAILDLVLALNHRPGRYTGW